MKKGQLLGSKLANIILIVAFIVVAVVIIAFFLKDRIVDIVDRTLNLF